MPQVHFYKTLLISLFFACCSIVGETQSLAVTRDYLIQAYRRQGNKGSIFEVARWRKDKLRTVKASLTSLPATVKSKLIGQADAALKDSWPALPLSLYLEFDTNGNRTNYETAYFNRRRKLTRLVIGELLARNGKYITAIADGLWLILEESSWVLPAHLSLQKAGPGLPDPNEEVVDLFSAETAAMISWIHFLFVDELNELSPLINSRITSELTKRIVEPYLNRNDFWWMGFTGRRVNNWNIWINTNVLLTAALAINNKTDRTRMIEKSMHSADFFINGYPADGGCDEGPGYWSVAGGILGLYLDLLSDMSNNKLDFTKNNLFHNIGSYIHKVHIDHNRFVNFADAPAAIVPDPAKVFTYGKMFDDQQLKQFAAYCYSIGNNWKTGYTGWELTTFINNLEADSAIRGIIPQAPLKMVNWLPDLGMLCMRQEEGSGNGMFVGVKAGHNGESHNHNDVGHFVIYYDGEPVVIDVGPGTYTKDTFSPKRWEIWNYQSQWHNCPVINGIQQKNGKRYKAKNTTYTMNDGAIVFSTNLAGVYPGEAKVNSWQRKLTFTPLEGVLLLEERYNLQEYRAPFKLNFITAIPAKKIREGLIKLKNVASSGKSLVLQYNPDLFEVQVEEKAIADPKLSQNWGDSIYRLVLQSKKSYLKGAHALRFKVEEF